MASRAAPRSAALWAQDQQSPNDLRQEAERLRQEAKQLRMDLDAALARIKALEAKLADAEQAAKDAAAKAGGSTSAPTVPAQPDPAAPIPAEVPADVNIGPGGLLASMQADYLKNFSSAPPPPSNPKEQLEFDLHMKKLESWCAKANRDGIRSLTWIGRIDPNSMRANGRLVSLAFLFKNGKREFRVEVTLDKGLLARVTSGDMIDLGDLAITAVVRPRVRVNTARAEPGAFETTPLVGPYLEFGFDYDIKSIIPAEKAKNLPAKGS